MYYETNNLLSNNNSLIYNKEKRKQVEIFISYKSAMDLNSLLFESFGPKIPHIQVYQVQVVPMYKYDTNKYYPQGTNTMDQTSTFDLTVSKIYRKSRKSTKPLEFYLSLNFNKNKLKRHRKLPLCAHGSKCLLV